MLRRLLLTVPILFATAISISAATFVVTNADDSGVGSLRDALTQANSNAQPDTINFDPQFFATARTIVLASELQITADGADPGQLVTINGPGPDRLTISGNNAVRPFYAAPNASVAMSGMTVRDGNAVGTEIVNAETSGGGIACNSCTLTLTNMVIRNNTAPRQGGGILVAGAKSFTLLDSVVTENSASVMGGIWETFSAVKVIRNTTISNNTAKQHVGGASFQRGSFTMENCLVTGNKAGTVFGGQTGGLDFYATEGTITDTVVSNNSAGFNTDGSPGPGGNFGGISAEGGPMTFRRVTVSGNRISGRGYGGGMNLRGNMTVIDSLISGNDGGEDSGGISTAAAPGPITIINTTFAGNAAKVGGAIRNLTAGLSVINSTFVNNVARDRQAFRNGGGDNSGGAIFSDSGGTVTVQNSILAGNSGPSGPDVAGSFTSNGYNIIGNTFNSTGFGATGDQLNVDPLLDPNGLQDNGGPTLTIALQPNSPAIDQGISGGIKTDQRGVDRPSYHPAIANAPGGDGADIGAFELALPPSDTDEDGIDDSFEGEFFGNLDTAGVGTDADGDGFTDYEEAQRRFNPLTVNEPINQPDALIGATKLSLLGDNRYDSRGTGQTKRARIARGSSKTGLIYIQNDAATANTILVKGSATRGKIVVRYLYQGVDVTGEVVAGTFKLVDIPPGDGRYLKVVAKVKPQAAVGKTYPIAIDATSTSDDTAIDRVIYKVTTK